jgi:hypothetical protein
MTHDLIRTWLQLPEGSWPPDHYALLGLKPGESDPVQIEQHVYERMEKVRRYQLTHPEAATEAMNRLAQALICLTDPKEKRSYDARLFPEQAPAVNGSAALARPPLPPSDPLAWLFGPWEGGSGLPSEPPKLADWTKTPPPTRLPSDTATMPAAAVETPATSVRETNGVPLSPDQAASSAGSPNESPSAPLWPGRGLATKRALYARLVQTRQLLWVWNQTGRYLNDPTRTSMRPAAATAFIRLMQALRDLLRGFPRLLGEAGQPGYLVLALARQQMIVPMLLTLLPSQREALGRDWQAGRNLLTTHLHYLRQELRTLRRRSWLARAYRVVRAALNQRSDLLLLILALAALNLALPELRAIWPWQTAALVLLSGLCLLWWWVTSRPVRLSVSVQPKTDRRPRTPARRQPNSSRA